MSPDNWNVVWCNELVWKSWHVFIRSFSHRYHFILRHKFRQWFIGYRLFICQWESRSSNRTKNLLGFHRRCYSNCLTEGWWFTVAGGAANCIHSVWPTLYILPELDVRVNVAGGARGSWWDWSIRGTLVSQHVDFGYEESQKCSFVDLLSVLSSCQNKNAHK